MNKPPVWGCPWHGRVQGGQLTLPNGEQLTWPQPDGTRRLEYPTNRYAWRTHNAGMTHLVQMPDAPPADLYASRKIAAATAGVSLSTLQRWIAEEGAPAFDSLAKLAYGKGASLDWVATGMGAMQPGIAPAEHVAELLDSDVDKYSYIPLYDARCSSGHGAWNERARILTHLAFTRYSLRKKGLSPDNLACLRNDGDSMLGLIDDDDTVMIDLSRDNLEGEGVYVILLDDHLYAKRLQRQFDGSIHIISENKAYPMMTVPRASVDQLQIVGRAVWAGGWLI